MSPVERLRELLEESPTLDYQYTGQPIEYIVRKADDPEGFQFLNVYAGTLEVAIEWKHDTWYLSNGKFDGPSWPLRECYGTIEEVFLRISSLIIGSERQAPEDKISELEKQVKVLTSRLKKANERLAQYDRIDNNRFRYESDYLPYEDDRYE